MPDRPGALIRLDQSLNAGSFFANELGRTEYLSIETDPLEPVMKTQQIGETHTAVDFGCGTSNELADFRQMCFRMTGHQTGFLRHVAH